jgi:membrane protein
MGSRSWRQLLWDSARAWTEDRAFRMAAALSFYSILSVAPLLLIATALAGLVFGDEAVQGDLEDRLDGLVGKKPAAALVEILGRISRNGNTNVFTVVGFVGLLLGASWVFSELQDALDTIWKAPRQQSLSLLGQVRNRLLSFALVFVTGLVLLTVLAASVAVIALSSSLGPAAFPTALAHGVNFVVAFLLVALLFALLYRYLPIVPVRWRDVWGAAAGTALLYLAGEYAISFYLGYCFLTSAFGAAGAVLVLLMWVYYSALIFLFGAEFSYTLASR